MKAIINVNREAYMGQGGYTMIALGTTKIPNRPVSVKADDWWGWQAWLDSTTGGRIRSQYESQSAYLAIPIAISDGWLLDYWKVPMTLDGAVLPINDLANFVAEHIEEANRLWALAQEEARKIGRELPAASLLLISDFD
jgi:hypothetical protein